MLTRSITGQLKDVQYINVHLDEGASYDQLLEPVLRFDRATTRWNTSTVLGQDEAVPMEVDRVQKGGKKGGKSKDKECKGVKGRISKAKAISSSEKTTVKAKEQAMMAGARTKVRPKAKARLRKGKEITTKVRMVEAKDKEVTKAGIKTATMSIKLQQLEWRTGQQVEETQPAPNQVSNPASSRVTLTVEEPKIRFTNKERQ